MEFINEWYFQSKKAYLKSVDLWHRAISRVLKNVDSHEQWLENRYGNGDLITDGNPIYSIIDRDENKALKILQSPFDKTKPLMQCWTGVFDEGEDSSDEDFDNTNYLSISLVHTKETEQDALELVKMWFEDYDRMTFFLYVFALNAKYQSTIQYVQNKANNGRDNG